MEHNGSELKREHAEVESVPEREKQEVRDVLPSFGISSGEVAEELSHDKKQWVVISSIVMPPFLFIFGYVKTKLTGTAPLWGAVKTMLIGGSRPTRRI